MMWNKYSFSLLQLNRQKNYLQIILFYKVSQILGCFVRFARHISFLFRGSDFKRTLLSVSRLN